MKRRMLAGTAALAALLTVTVLPVHAGTNGQQLQYIVGCYANYSQTDGRNQNGQYEERWVYTPAAVPENNCWQNPYLDWGWWWRQTVTVAGWWGYDGNTGSQSCGSSNFYAPQSQDGDWVDVTVPC